MLYRKLLYSTKVKIIFEGKVNSVGIFLVTVKEKYGFSSNMPVF